MVWWNLQYSFGLALGRGCCEGIGHNIPFSIDFSRTLERGLPKLENLLGGCLTALIRLLRSGCSKGSNCTVRGGCLTKLTLTLLPLLAGFLFAGLALKNFFSYAKSDSFCTPNLRSSSKLRIPRSPNFLYKASTQPSIAITN